jgi:hypothetical protein
LSGQAFNCQMDCNGYPMANSSLSTNVPNFKGMCQND